MTDEKPKPEPATKIDNDEVVFDAPKSEQTLDDVLIAMDIVDTLRHREQLVLGELDADAREKELILRLKEIYTAQGIEVSDETLMDGVKALEENRFVYTPPKPSWKTKLAKIYIKRDKWLKPVTGSIAALIVASGMWHFGVSQPQKAKAEAIQTELQNTIPDQLALLRTEIQELAENDRIDTRVETYYQDGIDAVKDGDRDQALTAISALNLLKGDLEEEYTVRIVSRPNEYSGLFRIPDDAPQRPNYYLIVEAVDGAGRVLEVPVSSIETQNAKRVKIWGVRVPKAEFDRVAADKKDDSIIQFSEIGKKEKGHLTPDFTIETLDGTIFSW
ncbi:DUF6384 family protein [Hirschia maritima]|uniref:DUF6384 family protein n=1 Tax=Hirschia maritima TaxID=1121961 RepID=UPI000380B051|nr:DUF6384 family protein [Hirschia maritima]